MIRWHRVFFFSFAWFACSSQFSWIPVEARMKLVFFLVACFHVAGKPAVSVIKWARLFSRWRWTPLRFRWSESFYLCADGELRFASYYGDHMVLQRTPEKAALWGYGPEGMAVTVYLSGPSQQNGSAETVKDGECVEPRKPRSSTLKAWKDKTYVWLQPRRFGVTFNGAQMWKIWNQIWNKNNPWNWKEEKKKGFNGKFCKCLIGIAATKGGTISYWM